MERIPTKLIVEKGQVFTTDKPMPVDFEGYEEALKSWRKEAYLVSNPESIKSWWYPIMGNSLTYVHDGIYDCPDGLVFEVKDICNAFIPQGIEIAKSRAESGCTLCHGNCDEKKQVAILSFKEPSKEEKNCNHVFDVRVDGYRQCQFCGAIESVDFSAKEPSSERPDFEKMANEHIPLPDTTDPDYGWTCEMQDAFMDGCEKIWNNHVLPRDEKIKDLDMQLQDAAALQMQSFNKIQSLEQEIERLRETLNPDYNPELFRKWLSTPDGMNYTKWFFSEDEDGKVMYEKAKEEVLKELKSKQ